MTAWQRRTFVTGVPSGNRKYTIKKIKQFYKEIKICPYSVKLSGPKKKNNNLKAS